MTNSRNYITEYLNYAYALKRRTVSLDEKIKKAEATVIALKAKYDAALDELEKTDGFES